MAPQNSNEFIYTFMQRKAPIPAGNYVRKKMVIREEDSMINYPKDIRGTILLCARRPRMPLRRPPRKLAVAMGLTRERMCCPPQEAHEHAHGGENGR